MTQMRRERRDQALTVHPHCLTRRFYEHMSHSIGRYLWIKSVTEYQGSIGDSRDRRTSCLYVFDDRLEATRISDVHEVRLDTCASSFKGLHPFLINVGR